MKVDILALFNHEITHATLYTENGQRQVDISAMSPMQTKEWMTKIGQFMAMA